MLSYNGVDAALIHIRKIRLHVFSWGNPNIQASHLTHLSFECYITISH